MPNSRRQVKERAARRPLVNYDLNPTGGRRHSGAFLDDKLSKWLAALASTGMSIHSIMERTDKPANCPEKLETILNWWAYGEIKLLKQGAANCLYSQFAERLRRAQDAQASAGYDKLIWLEERLLNQAKWLHNPDYDRAHALEFLRAGRDYPEPKYILNPNYIEPSTAQIVAASIRWRIARLRPDKYGDKLEIFKRVSVEHSFSEDAPDWLQRVIADKAPQDRRAGAVDALPAPAEQPLDMVLDARTAERVERNP